MKDWKIMIIVLIMFSVAISIFGLLFVLVNESPEEKNLAIFYVWDDSNEFDFSKFIEIYQNNELIEKIPFFIIL